MRTIRGKEDRELDPAGLAAWTARFRDVIVDLGTGDGRFVRHLAQRCPTLGVIGVDAAQANLSANSRRAPDNALFVVADALALPADLRGLATRLTANFPWGSLLHGLLDGHAGLLAGLAAIGRPGASLEVRLNAGALREAGWELAAGGERVAETLARYGFAVNQVFVMPPNQLRAFPTTWAKRLAFGREPRAIGIGAALAHRADGLAVAGPTIPATDAKIAASPSAMVTPVASWRLNW
jgi:16S rRNA (adenine(1408)-N(1))-methyltransferase